MRILFQSIWLNDYNNFHVQLFRRESFSRQVRPVISRFAQGCNNLRNNVAGRRVALAAISLLVTAAQSFAQSGTTPVSSVQPDDTCIKVRKVFVGLNDIGKKGNTKIIPFSKPYYERLASYFDRGCPQSESFPLPQPGADMQLANTAAHVVTSGGIAFRLGAPLTR